MESCKEQLTERLVELMERTFVRVRPRHLDEWLDIELTMAQLRTLVLLSQGPQRMGSMSRYLGTTLSSVTSMVDRLVDKGLAERESDPDDRRVVKCRLTARGQGEMGRFWEIRRPHVTDLAGRLSLDQLHTVLRAIEVLHQVTLDLDNVELSECGPGSGVQRDIGRPDSTYRRKRLES